MCAGDTTEPVIGYPQVQHICVCDSVSWRCIDVWMCTFHYDSSL